MSLYLSANKLVSDYGTVGDYLIEWRLGSVTGEVVFITGEGTDPLLQAIHPFTDEIVQSGTLYPVIIYAEFDGIKYDLVPGQGGTYSPDLLNCLELYYQVIESITCSNGWVTGGNYSHSWVYDNVLDPAINASRTIKFDLNSDGTTNFLAWQFTGYEVVDRFTIYYYHINDLENPEIILDWKIGTNLSGNDFISSPLKYDWNKVTSVIDLQPYSHVSGDYLIFQVIPRTEEPLNLNTNWDLDIKCLASFNDNTYADNMRVIDTDTVSIVYDTINCRYDVSWQNLVPYDLPSHYRTYLDTRWFNNIESPSTTYWYDYANYTFHAYLRNSINTTWGSVVFNYTCSQLNGSLNIDKTSNVITYTYSDNTDYTDMKTYWYDTVLASSHWTDLSSDPYNRLYYKYFRISARIATSCGDAYTMLNHYVWRETPIVFNDTEKTITMTLVSMPTVTISPVDCDDLYNEAVGLYNGVQSTINATDFNYTTYVHSNELYLRYAGILSLYDTVNITNYRYYEVDQSLFTNITPTGWQDLHDFNNTTIGWGLMLQTVRITITDEGDPENNFRIETFVNPDGTYTTATIVYEISEGVVIIP